MQKQLFLVLFVLGSSACVSIPNTKNCSVAGTISAGAICADSLTPATSDMTLDEFIDFLEPQVERPDPLNPANTLPARAGAICRSAEDHNREKTALEQACRKLGRRCSYEIRQAIGRMTTPTVAM